MQNDIFRSYCEQHAKVLEWFKCHQNYSSTCPDDVYQSSPFQGKVTSRSERKLQNGKRTAGRSKKFRSNNSEKCKQDQYDTYDEDFEMVVTDEMADFFLISAQHKKERDERKRNRSGAEDADDSSEEHAEEKSSGRPFSEVTKPGEKRIKEMQELYGEGARKIFAMETAMQLTFQRAYDQKMPQPWPTLPLNMKFD